MQEGEGAAVQMEQGHQSARIASWQWFFFALLQIFNFYQIIHHAMWRDELQIWSIVRESSSLSELFHNMRYDGFPPLWYLCLWGLSFISTSPLTMQLFHYACSFVAQFLVMSRAPFSWGMKLAIVAGYFISFEYCIISRAYVLGVLLLFLLCSYRVHLANHPLLRGAILGLLANTSVYGAILSIAFVADELWVAFGNRKKYTSPPFRSKGELLGLITVYGVLFFVAVAFMIPPYDVKFARGWNLNFDIAEMGSLFHRNLLFMVPIPTPKIAFWNSVAMNDAGIWVSVPVSLGVLLAIWYALKPAPRYLGVFSLGFSGIWLFSVIGYLGFLRHIGAAMVLFIACVWLMAATNYENKIDTPRSSHVAIWCILIANCIAWGMASYYHLRYDFSGSREMARIIQRSGKSTHPIIADIDYAASSVAGYLGRPLYYITNDKFQTYIRWNTARADDRNPEKALAVANDLAVRENGRALLLLNYSIVSENAKLLARTHNAIEADEEFYLYEYVRH
jgi:hypothetical protein